MIGGVGDTMPENERFDLGRVFQHLASRRCVGDLRFVLDLVSVTAANVCTNVNTPHH